MIVQTLQSTATPVIGGPKPAGFNVRFVDSVNGDDANDGASAATPYATLARAAQDALDSDSYVLLARGSRFREELIGWTAGVKIRPYGTGDRPIVDGRDIAANASFTKTSGQTNVYQIDWTHDFDAGGGNTAHRVWEDDVMLTRAASLAACDSTAGSFYAAAPTSGGPDTIYVHASDGSAPAVGNHEYAITKRRWCIQLYESYKQGHVTGVEAIGNADKDGSICVDGYAEDCIARDGRIHNAFIMGEAYNCQALAIEAGANSTMFVTYANASGGGPANRNTLYRNCLADAQRTATSLTGFYVHTDGVRVFGTVEFRDCRSVGCDSAFGGIQAQKFVTYRCTYDDAVYGYGFGPTVEMFLLGGTGLLRATIDGKLFNPTTPGIAFTAHGLKCLANGGGQGPIGTTTTANGANVLIDRCSVWCPDGGFDRFFRGNITLRRTILAGNNLNSANLGDASANVDSYTGDRNVLYNVPSASAATGKTFGGQVFYSNLAQWRAYLDSVGFSEVDSIEVDPQFADPDNLDFTIGNTTVIALGAGAEIDEEDDAELQAYWIANRVTEV